eukprot:2538691-Rhodomonas_salina.1
MSRGESDPILACMFVFPWGLRQTSLLTGALSKAVCEKGVVTVQCGEQSVSVDAKAELTVRGPDEEDGVAGTVSGSMVTLQLGIVLHFFLRYSSRTVAQHFSD